jgi:hypothetical protein
MEFSTAPNISKRDRDESDLQYHGLIAIKIRNVMQQLLHAVVTEISVFGQKF